MPDDRSMPVRVSVSSEAWLRAGALDWESGTQLASSCRALWGLESMARLPLTEALLGQASQLSFYRRDDDGDWGVK